MRCYLSRGDIECHLEGHYPFVIAHTGSCARPKPSHRFQFPLPMGLRRLLPIPAGRWPFPTLSLHSLCRCLDPYPGMSPLCTDPFLPEVQRPSPKVQGARPIQISPQSSFEGASKFRGCSHSLMFRPPHSLGPPAAPTAGNFFLGGRAVYTAQNPVGYLPRAAASLHARIGQLAWLDSHQLECSLVGCSRTRWTTNEISSRHRVSSYPNRPAEPGRTILPILARG